MEAGVPVPPPHAPPARRAAVPDSAQRALRPMSRPDAYPASGPSPLAALALSMQPGVRSSSPGASSSIPNASMRAEASSPRAIRSTRAGVRNPSAPPRLGVHLRHEQRAVRRRQPVEPGPGALGQQLPDLHVVLLARALLLALPGVAVEEPGLAVPLADQRRDGALVGELAPVVGEHGAEGAPRAVLAEDPAQGGERRQDRGARAVRQRQGQLEAARAVQEREEPGGVAPGALDGVHC